MMPTGPLLHTVLLPLLLCSTACIKVPVETPQPPCPIPPVPAFPTLHAADCGSSVCLSEADAKALFLWVGAEERALEMARTCLADAPGGSAAE
jgi:hypothetical protein